MQVSSTPTKWTVPFAQGDGSRVEIPATTADPTRFSLTLGSPPLTGQPPETGGVPPQLEDFNGAMNQIARIAWWKMGGGAFPYDATFAADPNVNGYPQGANIASADYSGTWLSLVDNNTVDPDNVGTGWAPLSSYGVTALTGQTGGTVTLTPAQAMKRVITVAGALTSNLTIVVPAWTYDWSVTNATTGAFTVTVKPAAGAGVLIPQNSTPMPVRGDGTNVISLNAAGRLINVQTFTTSGTYAPTPGTNSVIVEVQGGGGGGGGVGATGSAQFAIAGGGGSGAYAKSRLTAGFSGLTVTIGSGGTGGGAGANSGNVGGTSSFGALISCTGGAGGSSGIATPAGSMVVAYAGGTPAVATGGNIVNAAGRYEAIGVGTDQGAGISGAGNASTFGGGGHGVAGATSSGVAATSYGSGGGGACASHSGAAQAGGNGGPGVVIIYEYA